MYVIFEGVDTSGKSTQIALIKQALPEIVTTKEPGGTASGCMIRSLLLEGDLRSKEAEMFLFLADRSEHYERIIKPNQSQTVISDRGFISGMAYALANGDITYDHLVLLNSIALQKSWPQKVVLFWMEKELLLQRLKGKSSDNIEKRGIEYLMDVQGYMKQILQKLEIDHLIINASESRDMIHQKIRSYL